MSFSHELFHDLLARYVQRGSQRLAKRRRFAETRAWTTYATAAGTSLVMAAGAEAAVQHITPPSPLRIQLSDQSNGQETFLLDLDGDSQNDFQFGLSAQVTSAGTTLFPTMTIRRQADVEAIVDGNMLIGSLFFASKLLSGATISANETMTDFGIIRSESNTSMGFATFSGGEWDANDTGHLGVRFKADSENDHFGWVRVATESNENGLLALSVSDWAYEDVPGRQILAGDTVGSQQMPGDYDGNETVNGLDFTFWKETFGDTVATPGSGADGNGNSLVEVGDYNVWRDNLSAEAASGSAAAENIPEPATFGLGALALGAAGVMALRRRRSERE